jgi:DNA polymerase-3 subunit epsilon
MKNSDLTEYSWWGGENSPPENLKTKKQLDELGLKPVGPVGIIYTKKYDCLLYDINSSDSVREKKAASNAQLKALAKGRKEQRYKAWLRHNEEYYSDRNNAIKWAKEILEHPLNYVILDTETTGLDSEAEVVQIGVINIKGEVLLNSLVKPSISIPKEVVDIHGITDDMVADAPNFWDIYPKIEEALKWKKIIIYNADFDRRILDYCCEKSNRFRLSLRKRSHCAMEKYAYFYGEWSDYYDDYKYQSLNGGHNAIADCLEVLRLINKMANSKIYTMRERFEASYDDD